MFHRPTYEVNHGHNSELFSRFDGLTFDDIVLVPEFKDVLPDMVDTTSWFTPIERAASTGGHA